MNFALIEDGKVVNVIVADQDFADNHPLEAVEFDVVNDDDTKVARKGELYLNGLFISEDEAMEAGLIPDTREIIVPIAIKKLQAMRVMKAKELWKRFKAFLETDEDAMDEWELDTVFEKDSVYMTNFANASGLISEEVDAIFIEGAKL